MAPKQKEQKKTGKPAGKGVSNKDYLPADTKPPRDPLSPEDFELKPINREHPLLPQKIFPVWPSEEEVQKANFDLESTTEPFKDESLPEIELPPSFSAMDQHIRWLRPREYLQQVAILLDIKNQREVKRGIFKARRSSTRLVGLVGLGEEAREAVIREQPAAPSSDVKQPAGSQSETAPRPLKIEVVKTVERDETPEEIQKRVAQAEEEKKKAGKKHPAGKGKVEEPEIRKVKEVMPGNLGMDTPLPKYSKWATSQIQFIKDRSIRDSYTKDPIWKRIYPQREGIPIYNPHGKYWVKLHHLGEERLVEIDDRMPCNSKGHIMLPHSENPFELWPALLTKAILKLYSYQWVYKDNSEGEVGDASIVHALTGLLPERIDMGNFQSEKWPLLKRLLSDDHYFNKKTYVCGYCLTDYNPTLPSIAKYIKPEDKSGVEGTDSNAPATSGSRTLLKLKKFANFALSVTTGKKLKEGTKERPANVVKGFGYALMDCFENEGFDMLYAVKEDRDMVVEKTSPYSPEKRKKRRIIGADDGKKKLKDSDTVSRKSSRMGKKQIRKFQFVKIKSSVGKIPVMNAVCPFTNDEITMAKKCMLNRWEKPPDYDKRKQKFELEIRKGDPKDSFYSNEKEEKFSEEGKKDQEGAETIREEGDDENYKGDHGAVEPKTRAPGGLWMEAGDLAHCFQYLLVFHNPRLYSSKVCQKDLWADANELFIPNEDKMYMAIKPGTPEEEEKNRAVISDEFKDLPIDWEYEKSKVLITFAPNGCLLKKGEPATNYSCTIPGLGIKLTSYLSSKLVNVKEINGQLAFQPNIIAPFGYSLWVMSNYATVSKVPELEYLCSPEKGYIKKEVEIETPQLKQNRYYVLFRFNFTTKDPSTECILKLGITDRYLLECMRFHVVNQIQPGAPDGKIKEAELFQGGTITIQHNTAFSLTSGSYSLICDIMAPYNVEATKIKVALATLPEVTDFTNIELEEQAEYGDLYTPYKYGMIFRERVYVGGETPVSMHVRLRKGGYVKPPPAKEEKKGGKKEPEEKPVVVQEKDLDPPRRIKVEIMEDGEVIYEKMSYNHISIPHMKLRKTEDAGDKKTKNTYIIQCGFDISDWPECVQKCDETNDINWVLKVVSPGSVSIVKDTEKADKEQAIKESWEAAEPGRTEKGKQSRARFLALQKKLKGEELTEQEQELLKEPSQRKEEDNKKPAAGQAKKPPAKEVKKQPGKGGVPVKSEEEVGQVLDLTKPLPEPQEHVNQDIKAYLEHAKKERLIVLKDTKHKAKTRGLTEIEQIKQKQEGEMEAFEKYYKEKKEKDELEKKEREDQKAKFQQGLAAELTETVAGFKTILQKRAEYKEVLINRKSKEDELVKMIAADKIDVQLIEEAKKYKVKEEVIEEGIKMAEKCNYSKSIEDQLVKALADKNWAVAKELYTKATTQQLKMDPKMLNDCKNQLAKQKML